MLTGSGEALACSTWWHNYSILKMGADQFTSGDREKWGENDRQYAERVGNRKIESVTGVYRRST